MKRIKKILIVIFAVLLMFACQVFANSVGILNVDVVPGQPLDTDLITFSISGIAGSGGANVAYDQFSQNGTSLQLDLYVDMGITTAISYWTHSKQIQLLTLGTYNLEVRAFDNQGFTPILQDTYNTSFIVVPEPCALCHSCFWPAVS